MLSLRNLQRTMAVAILQAGEVERLDCLRTRTAPAARRLRVYRNNVRATLTGALESGYPVVVRLLGAEYFQALALRYVRDYPSRTGNLIDYGAEFPSFLETIAELEALPYLPDVARLERLMREAQLAAEPRRMNLEALAGVPRCRYEELRFALHPSARLIASSYPALRIWQTNQPGYAGDPQVSLAEGGDLLLVIRRDTEIEIERLSPGEFTLLYQLGQGRNMRYACESALATEPGLCVTTALRSHVARHTICGFHY
ncbi:MAG: hypothetical protein NFCOHLIN_00808 [Gammaproteobacteria bacterium]|nr:hypothetical protein [Gammaproteobacteria bacterium]